MKATIEVISGREGTLRVKCTSTGGKTFTMDVEGPGYSGEEQGQMRVEAVGDPQRTGNDTYSATTSVISGGCNGDTYQLLFALTRSRRLVLIIQLCSEGIHAVG